MKKVTVTLISGAQLSSVVQYSEANALMDQYYQLCSGGLDDMCFEFSIKNESDKLENALMPVKNILYITCREHA